MIGAVTSQYAAFTPRPVEFNRTKALPQEGLGANSVAPTRELGGAQPLAAPAQVGGANFADVFGQAVTKVNATMQNAEVQKAKVMSGETNNLHQAMLSIQEANVAFSLMTEVRNKLVESYQEIMRMQV